MFSVCVVLLQAVCLLISPPSASAHAYTITMLQKMEILESKINLLLLQNTCYKHCYHNLESDCTADKRNLRTIPRKPKRIIEGIQGPSHILFTKTNTVYVTGEGGHVYEYSLNGKYLGNITVPGNPSMICTWSDSIYTTDSTGVYVMDRGNNTMRKVITVHSAHSPVRGIKVVDDGNKLLVPLHANTILLYNATSYELMDQVHVGDHPRKMLRDSNGYIHVSAYTSRISVLDGNGHFVRTDDYSALGVKYIDGFVVYCDGSVILGDRAGKVFFVDKYGNLEYTMVGFVGPGDVGVAPDADHTLWIADTRGDKVYLY